MVFHWSPTDRWFSQVSRTLLSILLTNLRRAVIWMVLILQWFSILPVLSPASWGPFLLHQPKLVLLWPIFSTDFFSVLSYGPSFRLSLAFFIFTTIRPNDNQQKKRTYWIVKFAGPADHRVNLKESEKRDKYLDIARELKKNWGTW